MCVCLYIGMYIGNNSAFYLHQRGREAVLGSTHNTERYSSFIHLNFIHSFELHSFKNIYYSIQLQQPQYNLVA